MKVEFKLDSEDHQDIYFIGYLSWPLQLTVFLETLSLYMGKGSHWAWSSAFPKNWGTEATIYQQYCSYCLKADSCCQAFLSMDARTVTKFVKRIRNENQRTNNAMQIGLIIFKLEKTKQYVSNTQKENAFRCHQKEGMGLHSSVWHIPSGITHSLWYFHLNVYLKSSCFHPNYFD